VPASCLTAPTNSSITGLLPADFVGAAAALMAGPLDSGPCWQPLGFAPNGAVVPGAGALLAAAGRPPVTSLMPTCPAISRARSVNTVFSSATNSRTLGGKIFDVLSGIKRLHVAILPLTGPAVDDEGSD